MTNFFCGKAGRLLGVLCLLWSAASSAWARPIITALAPTSGPVGTAVIITGTGFASTAAQNVVYFDRIQAAVTSASTTQLRVTVPVGATSAARVTVVNTTTWLQGSTAADGVAPFRVTFSSGTVNLNTFRKSDVVLGAINNSGLLTADFNEDSKLDVLAFGGNLLLAYGDGAGGLSAPLALPAGYMPQSIAAADFTGDGHLDILALNFGSQDASLLIGRGAAGFASAQTVYSSNNGPRALAGTLIVEDMDGNGLLDALIVDNGQYMWLLNTGNGNFVVSPITLSGIGGRVEVSAVADFDGDGRLDVLGHGNLATGGYGLYVWRRNATNNGYDAPELTALSSMSSYSLAVGDINLDGRPDVAVSGMNFSAAGVVRTFLRNAARTGFDQGGTYANPQSATNGILPTLVADANGDGLLDIVSPNGARLGLLINDGTGGFGNLLGYSNSNGVFNVATGDLNGDGRLDFVTTNATTSGGTVDGAVFLNTSAAAGQNNAPTLNALTDVTIDEDSGPYTVPLTGIGTGGDAGQAVTITAVSSDPSILPNPTVSYVSPTATGSLRLQTLPDAFGTVTVTVTASDGQTQNGTVTRTFRLIVNPVNDQPTMDPIPDIVVTNPSVPIVVRLSGITSGAANENQVMRVNNSTTFAATITSTTVVYISPGTWGELHTYVSAQGPGLFSTNTVTVDDGQNTNNSISRTFRIYYQPSASGTSPTLDPLSDVVANRSLATQLPVALSGIGDGDPIQVLPLTVTATSSDPGLVSISAVGYANPATTGSVQYAISPTRSGTATITVTVDNGTGPNGTVVRSFRVTVPVVNATTAATAATTLQLYPNPSPGGRFTLETARLNEPATLTVLDMLGREVWRQQLSTVPARLTMQPSGLHAGGVYLVRLSTSQGTASRRLVVE